MFKMKCYRVCTVTPDGMGAMDVPDTDVMTKEDALALAEVLSKAGSTKYFVVNLLGGMVVEK